MILIKLKARIIFQNLNLSNELYLYLHCLHHCKQEVDLKIISQASLSQMFLKGSFLLLLINIKATVILNYKFNTTIYIIMRL